MNKGPSLSNQQDVNPVVQDDLADLDDCFDSLGDGGFLHALTHTMAMHLNSSVMGDGMEKIWFHDSYTPQANAVRQAPSATVKADVSLPVEIQKEKKNGPS